MRISPILLSLALVAAGLRAGAAVPPPEKLLPKDTLVVATAPDWIKARQFWNNSSYGRMWQDPAMRPFKDKFVEKFTSSAIEPLEKSWGVKFSDFANLAQGQVTFALVPVSPKEKTDSPMAAVLLLDTKDHAAQLKTNLASVVKKWTDAGKPLKSQKIRETDFTTFFVSPEDLSLDKVFGGDKPADADDTTKPKPQKIELSVGQSDSLLLISQSTEALDKILNRQSGGMIPPLEDSPAFQADFGPRLRESPGYVWVSVKGLIDLVSKAAARTDDDASSSTAHLDTILSSTGLSSINSASLSYKSTKEGELTQIFVAVPEDKRPVLLKMLAAEAKDSSPPPFVPADAVSFWRWRLNMARSWKSLEDMLNNTLPPTVMAQINLVFSMAGKDKDEKYDLKSELLNNLGDDIICYQKAPTANTLEAIKSPPTLYLLSSPNPDKLAAAMKVIMAIPFAGAPITDREFLGRKIYTAAPPAGTPGTSSAGVSFCASGGYVAVSGEPSLVEEFVRSSDSKGKALRETPGLAEAAPVVGGMSTGFFGYENEALSARPLLDTLRKQPLTMQGLLGVPIPDINLSQKLDTALQWADLSLLPPFDTLSKYFYFTVYSAAFTPEGCSLKLFLPTPPQLR